VGGVHGEDEMLGHGFTGAVTLLSGSTFLMLK
jgi:hypothetical protein